MKTLAAFAVIALLCGLIGASVGLADSGSSQGKPGDASPSEVGKGAEMDLPTVQGQVLKIEANSLIIQTAGGGQTRLRLDGESKVEGQPKVGDRVEAQMSSDGHVKNLKLAR